MHSDKPLFLSLFAIQLLASFLVLSGHYTAGVGAYIEPSSWEIYLNQISRYGTVLLAILTGFFTAYSFAHKKSSGKTFFSGKLQYIYIPFLLSGMIYNWILLGHMPRSDQEWMFILLGKTGQHLYFVFMLCQYYVFAYLFRHRITKKNIFIVLPFFLLIQYAFNQMDFKAMGLGVRHFLPAWLFTLYLGHALYEYRQIIFKGLESHKTIVFLLSILGIGSAFYFVCDPTVYSANHIRFVLSTFDLLLLILVFLQQMIDKVPLHFRKGLTFYVFLLHPAIILYSNLFFIKRLNWDWLLLNKFVSSLYLVTIWLISIAASFLIIKVIQILRKNAALQRATMLATAAISLLS